MVCSHPCGGVHRIVYALLSGRAKTVDVLGPRVGRLDLGNRNGSVFRGVSSRTQGSKTGARLVMGLLVVLGVLAVPESCEPSEPGFD